MRPAAAGRGFGRHSVFISDRFGQRRQDRAQSARHPVHPVDPVKTVFPVHGVLRERKAEDK
jgi:hypothetical protein